MFVGSLRAPPTSGAPPPTSGASHPSGHLAYSQFEHGDVQNGIPASAAPMQRCIWEEWIIIKSCLGGPVLGLDFLDLNQTKYFGVLWWILTFFIALLLFWSNNLQQGYLLVNTSGDEKLVEGYEQMSMTDENLFSS